MYATRDLLLYLDFDGVLHHSHNTGVPGSDPVLAAPFRYKLFQHTPLLEQLFEPWPHIKIVLSTRWAHVYSPELAAARLPPRLRARVVGSTFSPTLKYPDDFAMMPRGMQIAGDAATGRPGDWIALDDDDEGWPREHRHRLVKTHQYEGINKPGIIEKLNAKLAEMRDA